MAGRSHDLYISTLVQEAMLCKLFGCTPSQLRKEDYRDIMKYSFVYAEMLKKNPMALFM